MPRTGSRVSHKNLTASVVDSRNFLSAERRKKNEIHCPDGTRIAFTGGEYQDYDAIWTILDGSREKYPDIDPAAWRHTDRSRVYREPLGGEPRRHPGGLPA